jgi:hypothetical protein
LENVYPHYERSGNVTDLPPMNRKAKGESDAPVGPYALVLMHNNRGLSMVLKPYLEELRNRRDKWQNVQYRDLLSWVIYDPGIVKRWKAAESAEDALYGQAYEKMCLHLAYAVEARYPGLELDVTTNPEDEALDTFEQGRARDANKVKRHDAYTRYPKLVREVDEIKDREGCADKRALAIWNESRPKRENVSPRTLYYARSWVKGRVTEGTEQGVGFSRLADEEAS